MCSFQGTVSSLIFYICLTFMVLRPVDQLLSVSGDKGIRTLDPLLARQVLSQLSYTPIRVGLNGLEPSTSRLSGVRSNQLSYNPIQSGSHLFCHTVTSIVSSAAQVLTVVFGMGTGVSPERIATEKAFRLRRNHVCRTRRH